MSHRLIDLNDALRRLRDDGFNVEIHAAYLVVGDIPYVNENREICRGMLAAPLNLNGDILNPPTDHTIRFTGSYPCSSDGQPLEGLRHNSDKVRISDRLTIEYSFSNKPPAGRFENDYDKVVHYVAHLSGPATALDPRVTAQTFQVVEPEEGESPFAYLDTASARAEINMITLKLAVETVGIVGLGGTGGYVLDLLAKTPIKQIHLFDGDKFSSHNAFRAPGAASKDDLHQQLLKVSYFKNRYSNMHRGIIEHPEYIGEETVDQLQNMTFVFVCMDPGPGKRIVILKLEQLGIAFIDVGMGLYVTNEAIGGNLRVTTSLPENRDTPRSQIPLSENLEPNEYDKNIQIADLNALNAVLAVIRWKKLRGFYLDHKHEWQSTYTVGGNLLLNMIANEPD